MVAWGRAELRGLRGCFVLQIPGGQGEMKEGEEGVQVGSPAMHGVLAPCTPTHPALRPAGAPKSLPSPTPPKSLALGDGAGGQMWAAGPGVCTSLFPAKRHVVQGLACGLICARH